MIQSPPELRALLHDLSSAAWSLAVIGTLFESGLVDHLGEPRTADELAARCTTIPADRVARLLAVAAAHGIVVADGDRYRAAPGVAAAASGPFRATITGEIRSHLMQPLALLDAPASRWSHTDRRILQAQGDASAVIPAVVKMQIAPALGDLAARLERPGARWLDVGTGVGALAIAACRAYPDLHVVGLDPAAAPLAIARDNVARAGLGDRIELRAHGLEDLGDEGVFALVWLPAFFVPSGSLRPALARAAAALEPGGWVLMAIPGGGDARQRAVNALVGDVWGGPTPTPAEAEAMLAEVGLRDARTLPGPAWAAQLLAARKP